MDSVWNSAGLENMEVKLQGDCYNPSIQSSCGSSGPPVLTELQFICLHSVIHAGLTRKRFRNPKLSWEWNPPWTLSIANVVVNGTTHLTLFSHLSLESWFLISLNLQTVSEIDILDSVEHSEPKCVTTGNPPWCQNPPVSIWYQQWHAQDAWFFPLGILALTNI